MTRKPSAAQHREMTWAVSHGKGMLSTSVRPRTADIMIEAGWVEERETSGFYKAAYFVTDAGRALVADAVAEDLHDMPPAEHDEMPEPAPVAAPDEAPAAIRSPKVSGRWAGATDDEHARLLEEAHAAALKEDGDRNAREFDRIQKVYNDAHRRGEQGRVYDSKKAHAEALAEDLTRTAAAQPNDYWTRLTAELHRVADQLATLAGTPSSPWYVYFNIHAGMLSSDAPKAVPIVDTIATALGMTAEPNKSSSTMWYHQAVAERGPLQIDIRTRIESPEENEAAALKAENEELRAQVARLLAP